MTNNLLDLVFQSTYLFHRYKIWRSKIYVLMDQLKGGLNLLRHYPPHWRMENWTVINTSSFPIFHKNVAPCPLINFTSIILKKITSQLQRFVSKIEKVLTCHLSKKRHDSYAKNETYVWTPYFDSCVPHSVAKLTFNFIQWKFDFWGKDLESPFCGPCISTHAFPTQWRNSLLILFGENLIFGEKTWSRHLLLFYF